MGPPSKLHDTGLRAPCFTLHIPFPFDPPLGTPGRTDWPPHLSVPEQGRLTLSVLSSSCSIAKAPCHSEPSYHHFIPPTRKRGGERERQSEQYSLQFPRAEEGRSETRAASHKIYQSEMNIKQATHEWTKDGRSTATCHLIWTSCKIYGTIQEPTLLSVSSSFDMFGSAGLLVVLYLEFSKIDNLAKQRAKAESRLQERLKLEFVSKVLFDQDLTQIWHC